MAALWLPKAFSGMIDHYLRIVKPHQLCYNADKSRNITGGHMATTLIIVRHGESEANGSKRFAGHLDIPLSKKGFKQAELTARYIKENYHVDAVYASDLQRAYHTALPIAEAFDLEVTKTEQLREVFAGHWQGQSFDVLETQYAQSYWTWRNDIGNGHPEGGESVAEVSQRVWDAVSEIVQKEDGKTVVIATHATPIRALLCRVAGWELARMKDIGWVSNASVSIVRVEDGKWSLEEKSLDAHLADIKSYFPANV